MKLERWLTLVGMKQTELARMVGCSPATINRHLRHGRVLDPEVVVRIYFITTGAVRPDDFYNLDTMPPEIAEILKSAKAAKLRLSARRVVSESLAKLPEQASHE